MDDLAKVIADIESAGCAYAYRFEPATYARYINVSANALDAQAAHTWGCSLFSAGAMLSSSYGLFQIMGFNLVKLTKMHPLQYVQDVAEQTRVFWAFLEGCGLGGTTLAGLLADPAALLHFATCYNGPGQPATYAALIKQHAAKLSLS
jgi:hypothetical protein